MVRLEFVSRSFALLVEENIVVLGVVVEQSPHLVRLKSSMVLAVVPQEVHSEGTLQVQLVQLQQVM